MIEWTVKFCAQCQTAFRDTTKATDRDQGPLTRVLYGRMVVSITSDRLVYAVVSMYLLAGFVAAIGMQVVIFETPVIHSTASITCLPEL